MKKRIVQMDVSVALLVALHIILSRFLSINAWNMKIGFAFAAIFIAAYLFGPAAAAVTGALGDLLGAVLFPIGPYFPGFTLTCLMTGLLYGFLLHKKQSLPRIIAAAGINNLILSLLLNSFWIALVYGTPFNALLVTRAVQIAILIPVEIVTMVILSRAMNKINARRMVGRDEQSLFMEKRRELRKKMIAQRESLSEEERKEKSAAICERIANSKEFLDAEVVMIYSAVKGEADIRALENMGDKKICYPHVISSDEMKALMPLEGNSWDNSFHGIAEPSEELAVEIRPEDIDLVIAPCTSFDENCGRLGMGGGYYDRFLEKCTGAAVAACAFECQKAEDVYMQSWDKRADLVYTEEKTYIA